MPLCVTKSRIVARFGSFARILVQKWAEEMENSETKDGGIASVSVETKNIALLRKEGL